MYTLERLREYFADANIRELARATGLHYNVLYHVLRGEVKPSYDTLLALSKYIDMKREALNEDR